MKKITNKELVLAKKIIGLACALLCLLLMFLNVFNYTSSTSVSGGDNVTWSDGASLISFLVSENVEVLDATIKSLRNMFDFSYVMMWIAFCLIIVSILFLIGGLFTNKGLISKIGSIILVVAMVCILVTSFEDFKVGNTVIYLSVFTFPYIISLCLSGVGLFSTITLKDK